MGWQDAATCVQHIHCVTCNMLHFICKIQHNNTMTNSSISIYTTQHANKISNAISSNSKMITVQVAHKCTKCRRWNSRERELKWDIHATRHTSHHTQHNITWRHRELITWHDKQPHMWYDWYLEWWCDRYMLISGIQHSLKYRWCCCKYKTMSRYWDCIGTDKKCLHRTSKRSIVNTLA